MIQYSCSHAHHQASGPDLGSMPRKVFAAGETIRHPDEAPQTVYRIEKGVVRPFFTSPTGDDALFADLVAGDYVGELTAIDGNNLDISYEAVTETSVVVLRRSQFLDSLRCSPGFAFEFTRQLCDRLRVLNRLHIEHRVLPMKARLCAELLRLCRGAAGGEIVISPSPTHAELARRVASQRETVTKQLNQLAKEGVLLRSGRKLVIRRVEELQSRVDEFLGDKSGYRKRTS